MRPIQFLTAQAIFDRAVDHLLDQRHAALLPRGGAAYRTGCGGCPIGSFIRPSDYTSTIEGVPVRFLNADPLSRPAYMDAGVAALRRALLRAKINVYDERMVQLLSCLQNVHDVFAVSEWETRLTSIARQFNLSCARLERAA
ncbi:hypothetical protein [Paraburkholderia rhizosphaerae]|uniref:Uncharacterized protein n=1 Tax=Paraburkholderia rhizosphaerae TaxID=480658 RepID=A0A4R8LUX4_9BURK|nr:hypothetical protein [Paraburkholderia rhizosphaerae]TDY50932.1 hypothetical protein BX592_108169 [Paraburkholderia rhizosphaerae]